MPGALPWRPWVLVRLEHRDSALLPHILKAKVGARRLNVEDLFPRALVELLDALPRSLTVRRGRRGHLVSLRRREIVHDGGHLAMCADRLLLRRRS